MYDLLCGTADYTPLNYALEDITVFGVIKAELTTVRPRYALFTFDCAASFVLYGFESQESLKTRW